MLSIQPNKKPLLTEMCILYYIWLILCAIIKIVASLQYYRPIQAIKIIVSINLIIWYYLEMQRAFHIKISTILALNVNGTHWAPPLHIMCTKLNEIEFSLSINVYVMRWSIQLYVVGLLVC